MEDVKMVQVTKITHDSRGIQHTSPSFPCFLENLKQLVDIPAGYSLKGVNNVVVDEQRRLVQAGGYTPDRGIFCDMF
jgi:hypothetical protein